MEKSKIQEYTGLFSEKFKALWEELSDDLKWAKTVTELRLQMEYLAVRQERLFTDYGKAVFQSGQCTGPDLDPLYQELQSLEQQIRQKCLELDQLQSHSS